MWLGDPRARAHRAARAAAAPRAHRPPRDAGASARRAVRAAGHARRSPTRCVARWLTPGYAAAHPDVRAGCARCSPASPAEGYAGCCEAIERMDLRADLRADRRADARDRRRAGPRDAARAPAARSPTRSPARGCESSTPARTWPTSSSPDAVDAPDRRAPRRQEPMTDRARRRHEGRAARCSATSTSTARSRDATAFTRAVPGVHHPLRLGRGVDARGPRPPRRAACITLAVAHRARARARDRDARPRRAAQRPDAGGDRRGAAAHRGLRRRAGRQPRVRDRAARCSPQTTTASCAWRGRPFKRAAASSRAARRVARPSHR